MLQSPIQDNFIILHKEINEQINSILSYKYCMNNVIKKTKIFSQNYESPNCDQVEKSDIKVQVKEKLKQLGNNIEEILKIFDCKIMNLNKVVQRLKEQIKYRQTKICQSYENVIMKLQKQVNETLDRQNNLNYKIVEMRQKNNQLIQEFKRLSEASNYKINELQKQKDKAEFEKTNLSINLQRLKKSEIESHRPQNIHRQQQATLLNKNKSMNYILKEPQDSAAYQPSYSDNNSNFGFGCIPTSQCKDSRNIWNNRNDKVIKVNKSKNIINIPDRNHRFEFLLSNLRDGQESTQISNANQQAQFEEDKPNTQEHQKSVLSPTVIRKYHV